MRCCVSIIMNHLIVQFGPREFGRLVRRLAIAPLLALVNKVLQDYGLRATRSAIQNLQNRYNGEDGARSLTDIGLETIPAETTETSFTDSADTPVRSDGTQQVKSGVETPDSAPKGAMADSAKQTGGAIFGSDDTKIKVRKGAKQTECYTRLYSHSFGEAPTTSGFIPLTGRKKQPWYVLPFASAFPKCMLPRDMLAISQPARRIRIKSMSFRAFAFSPYITTTSQTLNQISMIPKSTS